MTEFRLPAVADENAAALIALARAILRCNQADIDVIVRTSDPEALASAAALLLIATLRGVVGDDPQVIDNVLAALQDGWMRLLAGENPDME